MAKSDYTPAMGDEAVKAKTGRDWYGWFKILDNAQAHKMQHREIAELLYEQHAVPGWWAQMVTVEYERARGLREANQKSDGYTVGVSRTLAVDVATAYRAFSDARLRARWMPKGNLEPTSATENKWWRAKWNGGARLDVGFYAKGAGKAQVAIQVNKLARRSDVEKERTAWKAAFEKLANTLS
jgi:hypothetical protein